MDCVPVYSIVRQGGHHSSCLVLSKDNDKPPGVLVGNSLVR